MITLDELLIATGGQLFGEAVHRAFTGISADPGNVEAGTLFAVLSGPLASDDAAIDAAGKAGAAGILSQHPPTRSEEGITVVLVGDVSAALAQWASYTLRSTGTFVIAVAGLAHRSMTARSLQTVLGSHYVTYYRPVTLSGAEGIAIALGGLAPEHQIAIVELNTDDPDQLSDLIAITQPGVLVISPLATVPACQNESVETFGAALGHAAQTMTSVGSVVLPAPAFANESWQGLRSSLFTYGVIDGDGSRFMEDVVADHVRYLPDRVQFDFTCGDRRVADLWLSAPGPSSLSCALAALTTGMILDVPLNTCLRSLNEIKLPYGYLQRLPGPNGSTLIDHTGAESPAEVADGLAYLQNLRYDTGRRIAVLCDLDYRGPEAALIYREIGRVASSADEIVLAGRFALQAAQGVQRVGKHAERITPTVRTADAVRSIKENAREGDLVLVTGGTHSFSRQIIEGLTNRQAHTSRHTLPIEETPAKAREQPSWLEIDLGAVIHNVSVLKGRLHEATRLMVDVSANAYGHGLCEIGVTVLRNGVGLLAVESLEEGLELRRGAVDEPILVMGTIPQADVSDAVQNELMVSITDLEQARLLARTARSLKRTARVHLKVDAESAGYGLELDSVVPLVRELIRLDFIEINGLDVQSPGTGITQNVMDNFAALVKSLHAAGLVIPHISSEGKGALSSQINVVLVGGCLYGFASNSAATCPSEVRPVLTWKSSVLQVNEAAGSRRLAVIGAGYGGGFRNTSSGTGYVLLHGSRVPLVGPIEVGHCTVDISRLGEVFPGDEAIMIGTQGSEVITAEEVAKRWGCSALEVTTSIPPVIPRVLTETQ